MTCVCMCVCLLITSHTIYMHTYMQISTNTKCYYSRTWSNANLTRGRIVEWQRRRSFYGTMSIAYKSLATRNEGSFSFVSSLKSLLTQVDSDYRRRSRGRFYVVTTQAIRVKLVTIHIRTYFRMMARTYVKIFNNEYALLK